MNYKFRAWLKNGKRMGEVLTIYLHKNPTMFAMRDGGGVTWFDSDNKNVVVMQSSGLIDDTGEEIYAGDVMKNMESIVIVRFLNGEFSVEYRNMYGEWKKYGSLFEYLSHYNAEIIGNIHENPELLED